MKHLITYHNDKTGLAVWMTEDYQFSTQDPYKFAIMKETNELLRDPDHTESVGEGICMMLKYDGAKLN